MQGVLKIDGVDGVFRLFKQKNAAAAGTEQLRICVLLALCRAGERNSLLRSGCGLWRAVARVVT